MPLLLDDDDATRRRAIEIADELVAARLERTDEDAHLLAGGNDLLAVERRAFKLLGGRVLVLDLQRDLGIGRYLEFRRLELMVLDRQTETLLLRQGQTTRSGKKKCRHRGQEKYQSGHGRNVLASSCE